MDGGAWWAAVHGVAKSWTRLSDFTFTFHFHALEKQMATHSSVLAWRIPGTGEPGGLPSMGSNRVGHIWSDLVAVSSVDTSSSNPSQQRSPSPSLTLSMYFYLPSLTKRKIWAANISISIHYFQIMHSFNSVKSKRPCFFNLGKVMNTF